MEAALHEHPRVPQTAVAGAADPTSGEVVAVFIVRRARHLTEGAPIAFCRESRNGAPFKRARTARSVKALLSDPGGKIGMPELGRWAAPEGGLIEQGGPGRP